MDNQKNQEIKQEAKNQETVIKPEPEVKVKEKIEMERYDDIEQLVDKACKSQDYDLALALNELTLARNLETNKRFKNAFKVVFVAFKTSTGITKRAGVFNINDFKDAEQAEDILISEDFENKKVLAVPRNSVFISSLK